MVRAVDETHAKALYRRPRELTVLHRLLDPFVHSGPETLRDHAPDDLVLELVPLMSLERLQHDLAVAELAPATGLLLVAALRVGLTPDRLEVRNTRLVQLDVDAEAPLEPVDRDLDLDLTEAGGAARPSAGRGGVEASDPPR